MIDLIWDMELGRDPDDLFTLFLLLGHPEVNLKAVVVTPGTPAQIGFVRHFLHEFGRDIPVGAYDLQSQKEWDSSWYFRVFGRTEPSEEAESGPMLLLEQCNHETTLLTGGPLRNLGAAIAYCQEGSPRSLRIGCWVCQGGFAGEGAVPPEKQLPQFRGLATSPTTNLNAHPKSTLLALDYRGIMMKRFVSKNLCHAVIYDREMHSLFRSLRGRSLSVELIYRGMDAFLSDVPEGKKFHDPLAACCAIEESIGTWAEVELYREKGEWGARLQPGSRTWIIVDYDREQFVRTLTALPE